MLAMALVQRDLGPRSPWGRFRIAVERFDSLLFELLARRRAAPADDSVLAMLLGQCDQDGNMPTDRQLRDELVDDVAEGPGAVAGVGSESAWAIATATSTGGWPGSNATSACRSVTTASTGPSTAAPPPAVPPSLDSFIRRLRS